MTKHERHSGIELMRIAAAVAVMVIHYCIGDCGKAMQYAARLGDEAAYTMLHVLENCSSWAVDGFIVITGYFLCTSRRRSLIKPLMLLLTLSAARVGVCLLRAVLLGKFSLSTLVMQMLPFQYFVLQYAALYLISPALNLVAEHADRRGWRGLLLILLLVFSVWPTLAELLCEITGRLPRNMSTVAADSDLDGMTIVNFCVMYLLGAWVRLRETRLDAVRTRWLAAALAGLWVLTWGWALAVHPLQHHGFSSAWSYSNPLVMLTAVVLLLLFRRIRLRSRMINSLAGGAYICFLIQYPILQHCGIAKAAEGGWLLLLLHMILVMTVTYLISWGISLAAGWLLRPLCRWLRKFRLFADFEIV